MTEPESKYTQPDLTLLGEDHIRAYRETDGEVGYLWNGVPALLLTTTGRRSGQTRTNALIFGRDASDYLVVASMGGAPTHPNWYLNLTDDPNVQVQVKGDKFPATARTADSPERERLWAEAIKAWPNFDVYQSRTPRKIPVVVLERVKS